MHAFIVKLQYSHNCIYTLITIYNFPISLIITAKFDACVAAKIALRHSDIAV